VKINSGFFEAFYDHGVTSFYRLVREAHEHGLLVISDVKRGDIGSTAKLYARGHLEAPRFRDVDPAMIPDAVTLAGYLGRSAAQPFIDIAVREGKGVFILVRPSDPGADEVHEFGDSRKFYEHMAALVRAWGQGPGLVGECGLSCVGAVVAPKDAVSTAALREAIPQTPFLVPGYGAQGADAGACRPCFRPQGDGAIVNASRSVIYAFENPKYSEQRSDGWQSCVAAAARDFAEDIRRCTSARPAGAGAMHESR
jgi:orotidine-5'-phosphate decarboxylase